MPLLYRACLRGLSLSVLLGVLMVTPLSAQAPFLYKLDVSLHGTPAIEQANQQGVVLAGNTEDGLMIAHFDQNGSLAWQKTFLAGEDSLAFGTLKLGPRGDAWLAYGKAQSAGLLRISMRGTVRFNRFYESPPATDGPILPSALIFLPDEVRMLGNEGVSPFEFKLTLNGRLRNFSSATINRPEVSQFTGVAVRVGSVIVEGYGNLLAFSDSAGFDKRFFALQAPFKHIVDLQSANDAKHYYALLAGSTRAESFVIAKFKTTRKSGSLVSELVWQSKAITSRLAGNLKASQLALGPDGEARVTGKANTGDFVPRFRPALVQITSEGVVQEVKFFTNKSAMGKSFGHGTDLVYQPACQCYWMVGYEGIKQQNQGKGLLGKWSTPMDTSFCVQPYPFIARDTTKLNLKPKFVGSVPNDLFETQEPSFVTTSTPFEKTRTCVSCDTLDLRAFDDTTLCPNDSFTINTGYPKAAHQWTGLTASGHNVTIRDSGAYQVVVNNGCFRDTGRFQVQHYPKPEPRFSFRPQRPNPGDTVTLEETNPAVQVINWAYEGYDGSLKGDSLQLPLNDTGRQVLVLAYQGSNECRYRDTFDQIEVYPFKLFIPNAFSPNGSPPNEGFKPYGKGIRSYHLAIYNRWGARIFEATNQPWKGLKQGQPVEAGVYLYKLEVISRHGRRKYRKGTLTVIK